MIFYLVLFFLLVVFSAFFSSSETAVLSLNRIRLSHQADRGNRRARLLRKILKNPDEFFSTILIGNNLVNIAAASISTVVFTRFIAGDESLVLLLSTFFTTLIVLLFAEVLPKSYAFRHSESLARTYAYPLRIFKYLFFPAVKAVSLFSRLVFRRPVSAQKAKTLTPGEIKHFLDSQSQVFQYNPENLRMINEIIDISQRDIKSIMTPRMNIVALDEAADFSELRDVMLRHGLSKIPLYHGSLDHITGIVHAREVMFALLRENGKLPGPAKLAKKPLFFSEYSSLNYVLNQFKARRLHMGVILDEYGSTIGIITLNDIFTEIFGEIDVNRNQIRHMGKGVFLVKGSTPVEEINEHLSHALPVRKDYTTVSGLFLYYFGKFPETGAVARMDSHILKVQRMGERKIDEILLRVDEKQA